MIDHRIAKSATYGRGITWGAFSVIEAGAHIGDGVTIGPLVYIGPGVTVGRGATIGARAIVLADVPEGGSVGVGEMWPGAEVKVTVRQVNTEPVLVKRGRR